MGDVLDCAVFLYLVGADVVLWPNQIVGLLYTVRWLLAFKPQ